jgi:hypothetical protein
MRWLKFKRAHGLTESRTHGKGAAAKNSRRQRLACTEWVPARGVGFLSFREGVRPLAPHERSFFVQMSREPNVPRTACRLFLRAACWELPASGRAGSGNRTRMASLEDWNFTIKLYPRSTVIMTVLRARHKRVLLDLHDFGPGTARDGDQHVVVRSGIEAHGDAADFDAVDAFRDDPKSGGAGFVGVRHDTLENHAGNA